jgi:hypothetical protein
VCVLTVFCIYDIWNFGRVKISDRKYFGCLLNRSHARKGYVVVAFVLEMFFVLLSVVLISASLFPIDVSILSLSSMNMCSHQLTSQPQSYNG